MGLGLNMLVIGGVIGGLIGARVATRGKAGMLTWALLWWVGMFIAITWGFVIPVPSSVVTMYMAIITGALFAYITSDIERTASFMAPLIQVTTQARYRIILMLILLAVPLFAAWNVYRGMQVPLEAPSFGRTVHPAPPDTITVHETEIDLIIADNPYRELDPASDEFKSHATNGRRVYFENCFWCHGDAMAGDGMFAHGLNPIPTNFTDQGVLPMLQESFLLWRVAKGAPGMPEEGGPWDSAMPAWETFLTEEEMWDAILFLYDYTGYQPRAQEVHH